MKYSRFCLLATLVGAPALLQAQASAPDAATALRAGFTEVSEWVIKAAAIVPADKYEYRPVATVRTVGQQIAHIADSYAYYCGMAASGKPQPWADPVEKGALDKATLATKLKQATDACKTAYAGTAAPLMANIAHTNLHYGNLITYLRMLGLTPPSS